VVGDPPAPPSLSVPRLLSLVLVALFFGGAVGYSVGTRNRGPSDTDVAFLQEMIHHHEQAVEMSLAVLDDPTLPAEVRTFAEEVVVFQRYEIGLMDADLRRWGRDEPAGRTVMAWMGEPVPLSQMPGLATHEEMERLEAATGRDAAALWLALMSRHHVGGIHMAQAGVDRADDDLVVRLAGQMAKGQRSEIAEYSDMRKRLGLPVPAGFTDPPTLPEPHH
jgi:uncharacterized protein (DUF305 family)